MVRYVWLLSLSVGILVPALTPPTVADWAALTMEERGAHAELIVLGKALSAYKGNVTLAVEKVFKRPAPEWAETKVRAGGVVDLLDVNPRPVAVSQRLILFLRRSTRQPDLGWECLNPYQGRIDVDGTRAAGDFAGNDFRWETRPLAEVEQMIRRALPPLTLVLTPARQRIPAAGAAAFRLVIHNVSPWTVAIPDPRSANLAILAYIPPDRGRPDEYDGGLVDEQRTRAVYRLNPGEALTVERTFSRLEFQRRDGSEMISWSRGPSLVVFALPIPSEDRRVRRWWSNSVLVESPASPAVVP